MPDWYASIRGTQKGPASLADLVDWIKNGELASEDWVFPPGGSSWIAASTIPELASHFKTENLRPRPKTSKIVRVGLPPPPDARAEG